MNPVAFSVLGFNIRWYSLLILIGVFAAYFMIVKEAKRFNISEDVIFNMFFWTLIIGIIGARLYYVAFNWDYFGTHIGEIWQIWNGGLAIHGGILFGLVVLGIYTKKHNINMLKILDIIVVPLFLAQAIGRWGNFFNSEAYGMATSLNHLRSLHIPEFVISGMKINGIYYTPTFFYESLLCLVGFFVLLIVRRMKFVKTGQIAAIYMVWYGVGRFFIEAMRTDSLIFLGFKVAQLVSLLMVVIGIIIFIICLQKGKYVGLYNDEMTS